jgi:hypothetical protein
LRLVTRKLALLIINSHYPTSRVLRREMNQWMFTYYQSTHKGWYKRGKRHDPFILLICLNLNLPPQQLEFHAYDP